MKNLIDSSINFSVITGDSTMQAYPLSSTQEGLTQTLMASSGNLYVLQQSEGESVEEALVAERSGEDLLLAFRAQEQARPALALERFFANHGQLHVLREDGEFVRIVSAQDNPQQGQVSFSAQALGSVEQHAESQPALGMLHSLMPASASAAEQAPEAFQADAPRITHVVDALGSRQGDMESGRVTDDQFATLVGTGTPGSMLEILDGDTVIGEVEVGSDGNWSFQPEQALSEQGHVLSARVKGTEVTSPGFVLIIDTIAPTRAVIDSISESREGSQVIEKNGHTSDNMPVIKGRAEAFSVVAIYSGKSLIGTSLVDANGQWEFASFFVLPNGEYNITARAIDFSGNTGLPSANYKIVIDTIPPAPPFIEQVLDNEGAVQGPLINGAMTDDSTPTLSGKAEAGSTVTIKNGNSVLGSVAADASGNWFFTPNQPLGDGPHSLTAIATDAAGNVSEPSNAWELVINTMPPVLPDNPITDIIDDHGPITGPIEQGGVTDDSTPTIKGQGNPGDTIIIRDGQNIIGEVEVGEDGTWEFTPETGLDDGDHGINVIIQDPSGNQSEPSDSWVVTIDTQAPDAPIISKVIDDVGTKTGELASGDVTDDTQPTLSGKAEAGSTVTIKDGDTVLGAVVADANGNWSFTPDQPLAEGPHSLTVTATDKAGNASAPSDTYTITVDTSIAKPIIGGVFDNAGSLRGYLAKNAVTDDTQPTLLGRAEAGSTVTIKNGSTVLGSVVADTNGEWSFRPSNALPEGQHVFTVTATDKAGNTSLVSDTFTITIDTSIAKPTITSVIDDVGPVTGNIGNGGTTDDNKPTLSGKAEAGSNVTIRVIKTTDIESGHTELGSAVADASGNWSFTPTSALNDGFYAFSIIAVDTAGNTSEPSEYRYLTITSITKPTITNVIDDVGSITGSIANNGVTDDTQPTLSGEALAGATVTIKNGSTVLGSVVADANGNWSFTPSSALAEGQHVFTVTATDSTGHSATSDTYTLTVDTSIAVPTITNVIDDVGSVTGNIANNGTTDDNKPTLSGKAEAGSTVTIKNGSAVLGSVVADASGNWSFTPSSALADGKYAFTVIAVDKAGNTSESSEAYTVNIAASQTTYGWNMHDNAGHLQGSLSSGDVTDDSTPGFWGFVPHGVTVRIYDGETLLGSAQPNNGLWEFYTPSALQDGLHTFSVTFTNADGYTSPKTTKTITIDTSIAKPTITNVIDDVGPVTGSIANNGTTDDNKPTLSGKAEAGSIVTIMNGATVLGYVVADANGNWSFTPSSALADGKYALTVIAVDKAGNTSVASDTYTVTIKTSQAGVEKFIDFEENGSLHGFQIETEGNPTIKIERSVNGSVLYGAMGGTHYNDVRFSAPAGTYIGSFVIKTPGGDYGGIAIDGIGLYNNAPSTFGAELFDDSQATETGLNLLLEDDNGASTVVLPANLEEDILPVSNTSVTLNDGGGDVDTLLFDGQSMSIDLDSLVDRISGVHEVDLGQGGDNSPSLSTDTLEGLGANAATQVEGHEQLVINGNDSNSVELLSNLSESLMDTSQKSVDGTIYQTYMPGSTELLIEQSIPVSLH